MAITKRQANKQIYWAWKAMKQRCHNPKCKAYRNYGARGINVCTEWQGFDTFCDWALSNGYASGYELDRVNNDKGYSPDNCRWIDRKQNINNRRNTILLTVNETTLPRTEWEKALSLPSGIVKSWVITRGKRYAEERLAEVMENGYVPRDFDRNHVSMPVRCVENEHVYPSISEAGRALNVNNGNIIRAIRTHGTAGGYHFEKV